MCADFVPVGLWPLLTYLPNYGLEKQHRMVQSLLTLLTLEGDMEVLSDGIPNLQVPQYKTMFSEIEATKLKTEKTT